MRVYRFPAQVSTCFWAGSFRWHKLVAFTSCGLLDIFLCIFPAAAFLSGVFGYGGLVECSRFARVPKVLGRSPISAFWLQCGKLCQVAVASNDKKRFEISEESGKERAGISHNIRARKQAASCAGVCQGRAGTLHQGSPSHCIGYVMCASQWQEIDGPKRSTIEDKHDRSSCVVDGCVPDPSGHRNVLWPWHS